MAGHRFLPTKMTVRQGKRADNRLRTRRLDDRACIPYSTPVRAAEPREALTPRFSNALSQNAMLSIRLSRVGKKKMPSYRLIVTEKTRDPWGKVLEQLGTYDPLAKPKKVAFDLERVKYWMSKGAQPSATVHNMLVDLKAIESEKTKAHPTHKVTAEEK